MHTSATDTFRAHGFKVTSGRVRLLELLRKEHTPLAITTIKKMLKGVMNEVTIYRSLESFAEAGFVRKVDLRHGHTHYEAVDEDHHHHHLVCTECGTLEDIADPAENMERLALKRSRRFARLTDHSLEFFGICKKCAA